MPRACSIRAVVSPPTPPPTMMAFMYGYSCSADIAQGGTRDQPQGTHTVSGVYAGVTRWINAATIGQETPHDAAVNAVRQDLGAARDPQVRERPFADVGR